MQADVEAERFAVDDVDEDQIPEQKAKVETLKQDCLKSTSTSEFHAMFNSGLEKILSPDQLAQWETHSGKAKASGECPYMKSVGAKTDKAT